MEQSNHIFLVTSERDAIIVRILIAGKLLRGSFRFAVSDWRQFGKDADRIDLFVLGDNFYADIEGARKAGLHPILLDPEQVFPKPGCPVIHSLAEVPLTLLTFPG